MRKCDTYYSGNASPWETGVSYRALGARVLGFHIPVVSAFYGGALRALAYARVSREGEDPENQLQAIRELAPEYLQYRLPYRLTEVGPPKEVLGVVQRVRL